MQIVGDIEIFSGGLMTENEEAHCPSHGAYLSRIVRLNGEVVSRSGCPRCKAIEKRRLEELQAKREKEQALRREAEYIEAQLKRSCIPADFKGKTFENFITATENQKGALDLARRFVRGYEKASAGGYGLLFFGQCGTGKSHLACAIVQSLLPRVNGLYTRVADIIRYVRSSWSTSSLVSDFEAIRMYAEIPLLVIDEVGVQAGSENEQQILFSVIDARLSENRPTIFLTNLPPAELAGVLGERIVDRIKGKCVAYQFIGRSYRKPLTADVFDVEE